MDSKNEILKDSLETISSFFIFYLFYFNVVILQYMWGIGSRILMDTKICQCSGSL